MTNDLRHTVITVGLIFIAFGLQAAVATLVFCMVVDLLADYLKRRRDNANATTLVKA